MHALNRIIHSSITKDKHGQLQYSIPILLSVLSSLLLTLQSIEYLTIEHIPLKKLKSNYTFVTEACIQGILDSYEGCIEGLRLGEDLKRRLTRELNFELK